MCAPQLVTAQELLADKFYYQYLLQGHFSKVLPPSIAGLGKSLVE